ncbi:MAG: formate dehydrogenase subunit gamma [Hyphomicrobiaceae bacterium]|nr:formate dehydrogenase subunit gamma [Hyphomicrobiaceae bacterium]
MTAISRCRWWVAQLAVLAVIALSTTFALEIADPQQVQAQSSVRPPAGAVQPATPQGGEVPGGSMGNLSDSETWRAIRKGIQGNVSIPDKKAGQLVQSEGDNWRAFKNGPIATWGALGLAGMLLLLTLFYLARGRIMVDHGMSGRTITRFGDIERMGHWLLAVSFIILALTGLNIIYGKHVLLPVLGAEAFAAITAAGKWLHNYVAFAFMASLVLVFVLWVKHNFPNRYDLEWLLKGGGMFAKGSHPPAKKFNAGQKILFWLVILGGISISLSGIAMLFPFQTAMFADTFAILNLFGFNLSTDLTPLQEMQLATAWHAIVSLFLIVVVIAHIYIGTIGMEGAFDAMGSGEVDENWAKEHHSVWAKEAIQARGKGRSRAGAKAAAAAE